MAIRVIQWATGGVGRAAVAGVVAHPELELVGCWVHSPDKAGRRRRRAVRHRTARGGGHRRRRRPGGPRTPTASSTRRSWPTPAVVARILASGKNVVTPLNWFFPAGRDESAHRGGLRGRRHARVHGTGIHPGGITERFPLMVSALSQSITHVRAEEFSDIRTLRGARGGGRHHALRQDARGGGGADDARHPRRRVRPVDRPWSATPSDSPSTPSCRCPTRWRWPPPPSTPPSGPSPRVTSPPRSSAGWRRVRGEPVITVAHQLVHGPGAPGPGLDLRARR